jgi:hypothetical protein
MTALSQVRRGQSIMTPGCRRPTVTVNAGLYKTVTSRQKSTRPMRDAVPGPMKLLRKYALERFHSIRKHSSLHKVVGSPLLTHNRKRMVVRGFLPSSRLPPGTNRFRNHRSGQSAHHASLSRVMTPGINQRPWRLTSEAEHVQHGGVLDVLQLWRLVQHVPYCDVAPDKDSDILLTVY